MSDLATAAQGNKSTFVTKCNILKMLKMVAPIRICYTASKNPGLCWGRGLVLGGLPPEPLEALFSSPGAVKTLEYQAFPRPSQRSHRVMLGRCLGSAVPLRRYHGWWALGGSQAPVLDAHVPRG